MPKFSVADAADRAGIERTTLYRKLGKGTISAEIDQHGNKVIDAAELLRVYPKATVIDTPPAPVQQPPVVENQQPASTLDTTMLQREIEIRDEKIESLQQRLADLEADKADLRSERDRLLKVIEEQSTSVKLLTDGGKSSAQRKKGIWPFRRAA